MLLTIITGDQYINYPNESLKDNHFKYEFSNHIPEINGGLITCGSDGSPFRKEKSLPLWQSPGISQLRKKQKMKFFTWTTDCGYYLSFLKVREDERTLVPVKFMMEAGPT